MMSPTCRPYASPSRRESERSSRDGSVTSGKGCKETLALGAAIGPEFSVELLRRVGANAGNELMNQLDGAAEAGLIAPMTAGTARYRFSHDLIRKTLYERLSPGRRAGVRRRIAEVLEDMTDGAADAYLAELAFHYYQAAQAPEGVRRNRGARQASDGIRPSRRRPGQLVPRIRRGRSPAPDGSGDAGRVARDGRRAPWRDPAVAWRCAGTGRRSRGLRSLVS